MKAVCYEKYGSPEVLEYKEWDLSPLKDSQIEVQVKAASVNPYDWRFLRGKPFLARLTAGLFKPKNQILGADLSGVVTRIGSKVTRFKPGDEVMAEPGKGAFAEFCHMEEDQAVKKPLNIDYKEAAAMPMVGMTAVNGLRALGGIESGKSVLINGASGGIGTIALQLARYVGARVTAVCSTGNRELALSLGADEVIDYKKHSLFDLNQQWDLIFDTVGNIPLKKMLPLLSPDGKAVIAGFTTMGKMIPYMMKKGKKLKEGKSVDVVMFEPGKKELEELADLLEQESIKAVLDRSYPFEEIPQAIAYSET